MFCTAGISGWRSWNFFACEIDAGVFERQVDALVDRSRTVNGKPTSLADLGYSASVGRLRQRLPFSTQKAPSTHLLSAEPVCFVGCAMNAASDRRHRRLLAGLYVVNIAEWIVPHRRWDANCRRVAVPWRPAAADRQSRSKGHTNGVV